MPEVPPVLAEARRSGLVESVHRGHAVIIGADGRVERSWGDPGAVVWPRSANKPGQSVAMVRAGLELDGELLALSAASHSGEEFHVTGVLRILEAAGLSVDDLATPPDLPYGAAERERRLRAGEGPSRVLMNCSGKHAAMLATCVVNGWETATYLEVNHPLQQRIVETVEELSGEDVDHVGVDGCGAPLIGLSLIGLARMAGAVTAAAPGTAERRVADAMRDHPTWVSGTERDSAALMTGVSGLLVKEGAEGVYVSALPDGRAAAVKVADGADRARAPIMSALLRAMGVEAEVLDAQAETPLLGAGRVVGGIRAVL